jgi:hypothetical protein
MELHTPKNNVTAARMGTAVLLLLPVFVAAIMFTDIPPIVTEMARMSQ